VVHAPRPASSFTQNSGEQVASVVHFGRQIRGPMSTFGAQTKPVQQSVSVSHVSSLSRQAPLHELASGAQAPLPLTRRMQQPDAQSPLVTQ
jgi:hypothetical protein